MPAGRELGMCVSPEDADLLDMKWNIDKDGYARRSKNRKAEGLSTLTIFAHSVVAKRVFGEKSNNSLVVDHINRNKLDNRRENLRMVTKSVNGMNSAPSKSSRSGIKGIGYHGRYWHWNVMVNRKQYHGSSVCFGRAIQSLKAKRVELGYDAACA